MTISYELERGRRKNVTIYVRDGKVLVKAPLKTDMRRIDAFVESKRSWIEKKVRESDRRRAALSDVLSGAVFLYKGKRLQPHKAKSAFAFDASVLDIPQRFFDGNVLQYTQKFYTAVRNFYRKSAASVLRERLQTVALQLGLSFTDFRLTNARTKWGSCDGKNGIRLNWHLLLLPQGLIDYVIVHELCHTIEHNHSRKFWSSVAAWYPKYKEAKACLKDAGVLIDLWERKSP